MLTILQWPNPTQLISKWGIFPPFLSLVILFLMLASSFIVSGVKSAMKFLALILNVILFLVIIGHCFMFFDGTLKITINIWYRIWSSD